jgi:hypothetical protein
VVRLKPQPLYPQGKIPGILWTGGWMGPRASLDAMEKKVISCPGGESNPGLQARSPSLYPLGYPISHEFCVLLLNPAEALFRKYKILKAGIASSHPSKNTNVGSEVLTAMIKKGSIFWGVTCFMLVSYLAYSSILKMEAIYSSETCVDFHHDVISQKTELFMDTNICPPFSELMVYILNSLLKVRMGIWFYLRVWYGCLEVTADLRSTEKLCD